MKIYIHHFYSEKLFYKIFHNTTDRIFKIENEKGTIFCKYKELNLEIVFEPSLNDNNDGIHLLDYWTAHREKNKDAKYKNISFEWGIEDLPILSKFNALLSGRKNWIITFFRTEKVFMKHDLPFDFYIGKVESELNGLRKNHIVITDNIFLKEGIDSQYKNSYFALTNTIFEWNSIISIRWYYEFKETFERLNFNYDLCYSVRQHKPHRVKILKMLDSLDNSKIYLQRTDSLFYSPMLSKHKQEIGGLNLKNIHFNRMTGDSDFSNLTWIEYECGINWDIFFRFLSKAKMQTLDESWAWFPGEFYSQYLSEKTYGLLLSNIPFISTHSYPLEILEKILGVEPHPFMEDFKNHSGDAKLFSEFVDKFMKNYDENYKLCKEWTNKCHELLINKIENENSLLEMIADNFINEKNKIVSYTKII
jgi:hypothetical protein